eukprot:UN03105
MEQNQQKQVVEHFMEFLLTLYYTMDQDHRDIFIQNLLDDKYKQQKLGNKRKKSQFTKKGKNHSKTIRNNKKKHAYHRW